MRKCLLFFLFCFISFFTSAQEDVLHEATNPRFISSISNNFGGFYFKNNTPVIGGLFYKSLDSTINISYGSSPHLNLGLSMKSLGSNIGHFGFGAVPNQNFLTVKFDSDPINNVAHLFLLEDENNGHSRIQFGNISSSNLWSINANSANGQLNFSYNNSNILAVDSNGKICFNNNYTFPQADGLDGQSLVTDGSGILSWESNTTVFSDSSSMLLPTNDMTGKTFMLGLEHKPGASNTQGRFMYFDKDQGAFRGGLSNASNAFDINEVGIASFAFGENVKADGNYSAALGRYNEAFGFGSMALGQSNTTMGISSVAIGQDNITRASASFVFGKGLVNKSSGTVAVGSYNDSLYLINQPYTLDSPVFVVGNGDSDTNRKNAMVVKANGKVGIGTNEPFGILDIHAIGTTDGISVVGAPATNRVQIKLANEALEGRTYAVQSSGGPAGVGKGKFVIRDLDASENRFVIDSLGKVGIGVANPIEKLQIDGGINLGSSLENAVGTIQYDGNDFTGYKNGSWHSLTADGDATNELQDIVRVGNNLQLTGSGSSVSVNDNDSSASNELQTLSLSGNNLTISNGNSVTLPNSSGGGNYIEDSNGDTRVNTAEGGNSDEVTIVLEGHNALEIGTNSGNNDYIFFEDSKDNILIGTKGPSDGRDNVFIGKNAGLISTVSYDLVAIGNQAASLTGIAKYGVLVGTNAGRFNDGYYNVALGMDAGGGINADFGESVFVGYEAGKDAEGNGNVAIGAHAGKKLTLSGNTVVGYAAGDAITDKLGNTIMGYKAAGNTNSAGNTIIGYESGNDQTTGERNTFIGYGSARQNVSGSDNCVIGYNAATSMKSSENTILGFLTATSLTTASENTILGHNAGGSLSTGWRNSFVGLSAGTSQSDLEYSSAIGYAATVIADNTITIGASNIDEIGGHSGWSNISDGRFKSNVREDVAGLSFIKKLRPVTYNLDAVELEEFIFKKDRSELDPHFLGTLVEKSQKLSTGFIAQEVEAAADQIGYDFSGVNLPDHSEDVYSVKYAEFVVPLVKGMQEQQEMIENLQTENAN